MERIGIKSSLYDYSVEFTNDFSKNIAEFDDKLTFVIDRNVYNLYKEKFSGIDQDNIFFVEAVEKYKNMDTVMDILCFWQKQKVRKNWKVLCFGGGITQDVTTIAANLYLRNIEWYFFPTTLLSMCDSCIGGKCGINFNGYKNQIGVFYPPKRIIIDTVFINTLTKDDYLNGWGELLKFSLTSDANFYNELKKEDCFIPCKNIEKYIYQGLFVKKEIIEEDEFDRGIRIHLNFAHTFGHAFETMSNYAIPHGTAVAMGTIAANKVSLLRGWLDEQTVEQAERLLLPIINIDINSITPDMDKIVSAVRKDKKQIGSAITLVLIKGSDMETKVVYDGTVEEIETAISYLFDLLRKKH